MDDESYRRFTDEIKVLRDLGHDPGVLPILDAYLPESPSKKDRAWLSMPLATEIKKALGEFPFPQFWGPGAGIESTRWIARSAKWFEEKYWPSLSLVYLPHLDYDLQRYGPNNPRIGQALHDIDAVIGDLIRFYEKRSIKVVLAALILDLTSNFIQPD